MAEIWKPKSKEVLQDWIDTIYFEASDSLNEWETNFVDNIQTILNLYGKLSEAQEKTLERIYTEKT